MSVMNAENLGFGYTPEKMLFRNLNFSLGKGEILGVFGSNGCGKSTFLHMLKKELAPKGVNEGSISVTENTAFVFSSRENNFIFDDVFAEITFNACNNGTPQEEIYRRADEMIDYLGIRHLIGRKISGLSGGERQLAALCGALMTDPELIILDEPFTALDSKARDLIVNKIVSLNTTCGVSFVIAGHEIKSICSLADEVIIIDGEQSRYITDKSVINNMDDDFVFGSYEETPVSGYSGEHSALMHLQDICFSYRGELLNHVSLELRQGEITALTGPNGCGKSTLFKIICGFIKNYDGNITKASECTIGYLSQYPIYSFLKDTLSRDIDFLCGINGINTARKSEEIIGKYPLMQRVLPLLERCPYDLSGGEMQLAAIYKLLFRSINILILDEPENHLDCIGKRGLADIFKTLKANGVSVLFASHDSEFVNLCADRVLRIKNCGIKEAEQCC